MENTHLRRYPHPLSLRRTSMYVSFLWISGDLQLGIFAQPLKDGFIIYPVESPTIYGGDEEKNVHSLLRVGFKAPSFLTGFTNF